MKTPKRIRGLRLGFAIALMMFARAGAGADSPPAETPEHPQPPVLSIEAPPSLASIASRLRGYDRSRLVTAMSLVGLEDPGSPIKVVLAPEDSPEAKAAPRWATGYALGREGIVVIIPSREPSYPHGSFEGILHHEVAHVLISRAAKGGAVPRWFNEGVAMTAARSWNFEDRARLIIELIPGGRLHLDQIDARFEGDPAEVSSAYSISGAFVRDLIHQHGLVFPATVLRGVAEGRSFEEAFRTTTGSTLSEAEASFYSRQNIWNRWVPFVTSSVSGWGLISLLALYARRARRARDARKKAEWALEDPEESAVAFGFGGGAHEGGGVTREGNGAGIVNGRDPTSAGGSGTATN